MNSDLKYKCAGCGIEKTEESFTRMTGYIRQCNSCLAVGDGEVRTTSSTGGQKGVKLARWDLLPMGALGHLAEHFGRGAEKYDDHQWRNGYEYSKGIAALLRHFTDWINGKDWDVCPEDESGCSNVRVDGTPFPYRMTPNGRACYNHTGSHHLDGTMWHAVVLREFVDKHPEHDDRYIYGGKH